jgi:hypothetical protein
MGDQKLLTKFRRFCDDYRAEYAFEGIIEGFDTIDGIDPERLTRGLFVRSERDSRLVGLDSKRKPPVEVGNTIIVVGRDARLKENEVIPAAILIPKERSILFSSEIKHTRHGFVILFSPLIVAFGIIMSYILFIPLEYSLTYSWIFLLGISFFVSWFPSMSYLEDYLKRPRLYHCDEKTWSTLSEEITERFGIEVTMQITTV